MTRPTIPSDGPWENHERRLLRIFKLALDLLRAEDNLEVGEDVLNRRLLLCIRKANAELFMQGGGLEHPVMYEANNQPDADDAVRAQRESKRPDFQWGLTDTSETDPLRQDKFYCIECKRLGKPRRRDWPFNRNYVEKGIVRFVHPDHGYAKSSPSGAMVGYMQSMEAADILDEVNSHAVQAGLSKIDLSSHGWIRGGVSRLDHVIDRPEVPPTPFKLRHLWVELQ